MTDQAGDILRTEIAPIIEALDSGKYKRVRKRLRSMHPAKIAGLIEAIDAEQRLAVWQQVDAGQETRILEHIDPVLARLLMNDSGDPAGPASEGDTGEVQLASTQMRDVRAALALGKLKRVSKILRDMHPAKVAGLLESLPSKERGAAWSMVETDRAGKVLTYLHDEICAALAREMDHEDLISAAQRLDLDDLVDLIQALPEEQGRHLLAATGGRRREKLESMLSYPEDSAGGLMNTDQIAVRPDVKIQTVLGYLRLLKTLPVQTDKLMVVDRKGSYRGVLRLSTLVTVQPEQRVADIMDTEMPTIPVDMPGDEVARLFQDLDLLSAPVVDAQRQLLGRITIDDVVDHIRERSDRAMMNMAGLDQEADIFAPVLTSSRRRALWLGINLVTAFLAAWVIGLFQTTLERVVALAVLMPIVASMGGIAGSQTLTLAIRGIALGQLSSTNARALVLKELAVGTLNSLIWAAVVAFIAGLWFDSSQIAILIAVAITINLVFAAITGSLLPLALERVGIDPALAGSVLLTTVTDVVGFLSFLGLATIFLV